MGTKGKKCSTSTDVIEVLEGKRMLDTLDTKENRKKKKKNSENKECGKLTRFYVDIKNGYVHIDMNAEAAEKALTLDGSLLGGRSLEVRMAIDTDEHDPSFVMHRCYAAFTCGGRYLPYRLQQAFKTNTNIL